MFEKKRHTSTFYKITKNNEPICFSAELKCVSDVNVLGNKRYIRIEVTGVLLEFLKSVDNYCFNNFEKYTSTISNNSILVKLPFRYKKYEINYINQASSDDLYEGSHIKATIEVTGVYLSKYTSMCTFKMLTLESTV